MSVARARRSGNAHERLANGVALWKLYDVLKEIYSPHTAYKIFEEVKANDSEGRIVEVSIYHDEDENLRVNAYKLVPI